MKLRTAAVALALAAAASRTEADMIQYHVAPNGSDHWTGRRATPNASGSDGPFATLEAARDAVRALRQSRGWPKSGVTVWLRGGVHVRSEPFVLTDADSGVQGAPVIYRAARGEQVRVSGGREVRGWSEVRDRATIERIDPVARPHVRVADLRAQGIVDFGALQRRGFGLGGAAALEVFYDDEPMTLAQWPNGAWSSITGVPDGQHGGRFTYAGDRPRRWRYVSDVWVHGYWTYDWADTYEKVASLDAGRRIVATQPPHGAYGYTAGKRFRFLNVLEELDTPGEWWLDRASGLLYFWPPSPIEIGRAVVSMVAGPLVDLRGASWVQFRGLTFECGRGDAIRVVGGEGVEVAGCTVRNMGASGITVQAGLRHRVVSCDLYGLGESGIMLSGGDRRRLEPAGHEAVNNHIHHFSRTCRTYRPAIGIQGVGNRAAHNRIHDAPHNAILMGGNDHVVEFNHIHDVCRQTGDAGAVYMGRNMTMRGIVIRHNHFHDTTRRIGGSEGFLDVQSVYLDDCFSGVTVYGNLFVRGGRAAMIGGGRDNVIENNVFVDCAPAIHVDSRGIGWASFWFDGRDPFIIDGLREVAHDQPPYSTRYPQLATLLQDEPAKAKGNVIARNIRVGGTWRELLDGLDDRTVQFVDNLTEGDPRFVDRVRGDWRLRPDSPAWRLGFRPIPIERMGLQRDAFRSRPPSPEVLRPNPELPDPFLLPDGSRMATRRQWSAQRTRLLEQALRHQYGPLPPAGSPLRVRETSSSTPPGGPVVRDLRLTAGPREGVTFSVTLTVPAGRGPFPAIVCGDRGWGRIAPEIVAEVVRRGYALAEFNREEVAPDGPARAGVYALWPDYRGGRLAAWAWGFHRVVDYLRTLSTIDARRIAVTGHSRGGKAALLAGATDERIALTSPNNSGCGGAGCYRIEGAGSETLEAIVQRFPYWFAPGFARFIGRVQELPFDQHTLKAAVAPRALLSTEALGDLWANPLGSQVTHQAAREVYRFLGAEEQIGIVFRPGEHRHALEDWRALLDFADWRLRGSTPARAFDRLAFPDAPAGRLWKAPDRAR